MIVTYHPAYLLRAPKEKRKAWEDLQFAQQVFAAAPARPCAAAVHGILNPSLRSPTALAHPCAAETR